MRKKRENLISKKILEDLEKENKEKIIDFEEDIINDGDYYVVISINFNILYSEEHFDFLKELIIKNSNINVIIYKSIIKRDNLNIEKLELDRDDFFINTQIVVKVNKELHTIEEKINNIFDQIYNFLKDYIRLH